METSVFGIVFIVPYLAHRVTIHGLLSSLLTEVVVGMLTALALGMILYIMFAELLPHVLRERPAWIGAAGTLVGFALVLAATFLG